LKDSAPQRFLFTTSTPTAPGSRGHLRRQPRALVPTACLTGALASAEPKTLRWALWHTPARLVRNARRRVVRILEDWPTTTTLLDAHGRIAQLI